MSRYLLSLLTMVILSLSLCTSSLLAQTTFSPGDVVITGFNTTGTNRASDNFAFLFLQDAEAGTVLYFSDNGWDDCGTNPKWRDNEGFLRFTASVDIPRGTVIGAYANGTIFNGASYGSFVDANVSGSSFNLNQKGEQIFIFQGSQAAPDFIFALSNNDTWQSGASDSHTSCLPAALTDGVNAISIPKNGSDWLNNAYFDCNVGVTAGTSEQILASLVDEANWKGQESLVVPVDGCTFTLDAMDIEYITYNQISITWPSVQAGREALVLAKPTSAITYVPSGDGSAYVANANYSAGADLGSGTKVIYQGTGTGVTVTGLTEGTDYYFQIYTHTVSTDDWVFGSNSSPEFVTAQVQNPTDTAIDLNGNNDVVIDWTNYQGTPQADWWNGGVMIVQNQGGTVNATQASLNGNATSDYTVGDALTGGDQVAYINTGGTPGGAGTATITGLTPGQTYHFKVFHNDHNNWSEPTELSISLPFAIMAVRGNNNTITNGSTSPALSRHTDFGSINFDQSVTRTFTIVNSGTGALNLTGAGPDYMTITGADAAKFSVSAAPTTPINPYNGSENFQITLTPGGSCTGSPYTATITIANDDPDDAPYTFDIEGTCLNGCFGVDLNEATPGTEITLSGSFNGTVTNVVFDDGSGTQNATSFSKVSNSVVTAIIPAGLAAGSIDVSITGSGNGTTTGCSSFNLIVPAETCEH